jgi:hypothetical protein
MQNREIRFPVRRQWEYACGPDVVVSTWGIPPVFRDTFLKALLATRGYYQRIFGEGSIAWLEMGVRKQAGLPLRLWTNGSDRVYLTLSRKEQRKPPHASHVFHVHGIAHELAHIVMYRSLINIHQLPDGWGEGWAAYIASFLAVPCLFTRLGPSLWPYPYNYLQTEGPDRYARYLRSGRPMCRDPAGRFLCQLHLLRAALGTRKFLCLFRGLFRERLRSDEFRDRLNARLRRAGCSA